MALGKDHLVLLGVLEAGELGHPHLVAMGFQIKPAQHIGQMRAEFPPLDGMAPELVQRALLCRPARAPLPPGSRAPAPRTWRHGFSANRMASSVAVSQACSAVTISTGAHFGVGDLAFDTNCMRSKPLSRGDLARGLDQFGARFHRRSPCPAPPARNRDRRE